MPGEAFWRWYRWVPVLMALACLVLAAWCLILGKWGLAAIDGTLIGVNLTNAGICQRQYKSSGRAGGDVSPVNFCGCPERDGRIYHQRETCTDPLAARLNWYGTLPAETGGNADD